MRNRSIIPRPDVRSNYVMLPAFNYLNAAKCGSLGLNREQ